MANPYSVITKAFSAITSVIDGSSVLRFPSSVLDNGVDKTITIRPFKVVKAGDAISSAVNSGTSTVGSFLKGVVTTLTQPNSSTNINNATLATLAPSVVSAIVLPIPANINDTNTYQFSDAGVGQIYGALQSAGKTLAAGGTTKDALKQLKGYGAEFLAGNVTGNLGARIIGSDSSALRSTLVGTPNPFLKLNFAGVTFKPHTFRFFLAPRNQQDSVALQQIASVLRYFSAPVGRASSIFDVKYAWLINFTDEAVQSYTYKFNPSYLQGVDIQYNSQGISAFHGDGSPVDYVITLQFIEMVIPSQETYDELYGGNFLSYNNVGQNSSGIFTNLLNAGQNINLSIKSFL